MKPPKTPPFILVLKSVRALFIARPKRYNGKVYPLKRGCGCVLAHLQADCGPESSVLVLYPEHSRWMSRVGMASVFNDVNWAISTLDAKLKELS